MTSHVDPHDRDELELEDRDSAIADDACPACGYPRTYGAGCGCRAARNDHPWHSPRGPLR